MGIPAISHPPRILMLYGSVRERSYSRLATEEAGRLLTAMSADVRIFNPSGLPLPDDAPESHPKVMELRELVRWSEGMVWCSPERHGAMTGIMKAQIDWIPLSEGAVRPSQGKTLAVMQVCGGSQSFNTVNQMRVGTVAKLAMRQPFVLFKGLTFQKLCLPGAFRPGDHHNKMLRPGLCVVHASPQYL
ncbi:arsenical resistance protein ArsH [Salmonella enterica subsp. enterica serovar Johannesburg]|nr:arsenical resistance protein ArsH [Salmonella enterica subsp. enterica serovar Johannesburg]EDQ6886255.1 arsenical resistance protein ArsH [Salmonella enterica subsp. enterica serovar Johannesburg]